MSCFEPYKYSQVMYQPEDELHDMKIERAQEAAYLKKMREAGVRAESLPASSLASDHGRGPGAGEAERMPRRLRSHPPKPEKETQWPLF